MTDRDNDLGLLRTLCVVFRAYAKVLILIIRDKQENDDD